MSISNAHFFPEIGWVGIPIERALMEVINMDTFDAERSYLAKAFGPEFENELRDLESREFLKNNPIFSQWKADEPYYLDTSKRRLARPNLIIKSLEIGDKVISSKILVQLINLKKKYHNNVNEGFSDRSRFMEEFDERPIWVRECALYIPGASAKRVLIREPMYFKGIGRAHLEQERVKVSISQKEADEILKQALSGDPRYLVLPRFDPMDTESGRSRAKKYGKEHAYDVYWMYGHPIPISEFGSSDITQWLFEEQAGSYTKWVQKKWESYGTPKIMPFRVDSDETINSEPAPYLTGITINSRTDLEDSDKLVGICARATLETNYLRPFYYLPQIPITIETIVQKLQRSEYNKDNVHEIIDLLNTLKK